MTLFFIILLIIIGLILILLELMVTPGAIVGIIGAALWVIALNKVYNSYGTAAGNYTFVGLLLLLGLSLLVALKSGVWKKVSLKQNLEGKVNDISDSTLIIGATGIAMSMLRPSGKGNFNGVVVEVATMGELVEAGSEIRIIKIENNKIFVK